MSKKEGKIDVEAENLHHKLAAQHLGGIATRPTATGDIEMKTSNHETIRKRTLEEMSIECEGQEDSVDTSLASKPDILRYDEHGRVLDLPVHVQRLRLEAIFHPKFENESQTDKEIRVRMQEAIQAGLGYLEVSLKHSGSLLLWSGGERFYSKNATDNVFTHVGEILLRQHFVRAYWQETSTGTHIFDQCSAYVQEHRLTLSFEVVTATLGDHGDRPKRDFLILTAVADRNQQRFWGTDEIVALAHRFRLPHNDAWVFASQQSVQKLFAFYDNARETSLADNVVEAMSQAANIRVESMMPHVDFQGDILEGIVIRYVPYNGNSSLLEKMKGLAEQSRIIAAQVPSTRPDAWELMVSNSELSPKVAKNSLTVNLRELHQSTKFEKRDGPTSFAAAVARIMDTSRTRRYAKRVPKSAGDIDVPSWTQNLKSSHDIETQRIAKLIDTLLSINVRIDYNLLRERIPGQNDRWLCIIHILHDSSFQKYRKNMQVGSMPLFRGFSVEMNGNQNESNPLALRPDTSSQAEESLMLKMKFLPYMVRTFGCRNGLGILRQGGVEAFVKYTNNLLSKWGISHEGKQQWLPFFRAWGKYALPRIEKILPGDEDLCLLTSYNYLEHLERFQNLYDAGKIEIKSDLAKAPASMNQGLVIVVAPRRATAESVADLVAKNLGNADHRNDFNEISKEDMENLCAPGNGTVCAAELRDGVSNLRKLIGDFGNTISIVMVGCSDEDIQADLELALDTKMYRGLAAAWRKIRAVLVLEIPPATVFDRRGSDKVAVSEATATAEFLSEMEKIKLVFQAQGGSTDRSSIDRTKPGLLVFFPSLPGAGKSSVVAPETEKALQEELARHGIQRKLIISMGDKTPGRYWPSVKKARSKNPSCLYIADKNVPSTTWGLVASICAETKAMGVPIIPDSEALQTTAIDGIRNPDGSFDATRRHVYPFSLHFLAVCLHRVLSRMPQSHPGKLDPSEPKAAMIVVMFYCLYRRTTADEYRENLEREFQQAGAVMGAPIEIPFFARRSNNPLPTDLQNVLIEALQAYFGYELSKHKPIKSEDEYTIDLEKRLREAIGSHSSLIEGLTVDIMESRRVFIAKFFQRVAELESIESWAQSETGIKGDFIEIVSIDVNPRDVQALLVSLCEESQAFAPLSAMLGASTASSLTYEAFSDCRFVLKTHVTMAHFKEDSQKHMRIEFGSLISQSVEMQVKSVLWDERVAAFGVELPNLTTDGSPLPEAKNEFTHITLWCEQGCSAYLSNELPSRALAGQATHVELAKPVNIVGQVSFWFG